jgi:transcriptional regulator with XRE-family HTH domain
VTSIDEDLIDELYATVGFRINRLRKARGLRQDDLAAAVGMTRSSIANTESGRQRLPLHTLLAVAQALGVRLVDLLDTGREMSVLVEPLPPGAFSPVAEAVATVGAARKALEEAGSALSLLLEGRRP